MSTKRFKTLYKKVPGTLYLTDTTIHWNPEVAGQEVVRVQQLSRVQTMFQSKATSPKISLKITFVNDVPAGGLLFVFTGLQIASSSASPSSSLSPDDQARADRQSVMDLLAVQIQQNLAAAASAAPPPPTDDDDIMIIDNPHPPATPRPPPTGASPSANATAGPSRPKVPPAKSQTPAAGQPMSEIYALRRKVLLADEGLRDLYSELVLKEKVMSEADFWSGREHLIAQQQLLASQTAGRTSSILDDRFLSGPSKSAASQSGTGGIGLKPAGGGAPGEGTVKTVHVTREVVERVFEEFEVVREIYAEYVGGEGVDSMTESEFWRRYFSSRLWDRHRASTRQESTKENTQAERDVRRDEVFDRYLEEVDDEIEPKRGTKRSVDMFLDLAATAEDHQETGNINDYTMQAGKQRSTLPLIRRFNEHSNRLVMQDEDTAGDDEQVNCANLKIMVKQLFVELNGCSLDPQPRIYSEIELDDLRGPQQEITYALDVQERQEEFDGTGRREEGEEDVDEMAVWVKGKSDEDLKAIVDKERKMLGAWKPNLPSVVISSTDPSAKERQKVVREGFKSIVDGIAGAVDAKKEREPIPDEIMSQVLSCHNAACEFLRQFWSATLPTPPGALGASTTQQKAEKARKMAEYLKKTGEKVDGVVRSGKAVGVDEDRIREALAPTLFAVGKALAQHGIGKK